MIQKIKCWFGVHKITMQTQNLPLTGDIVQSVYCCHCHKLFIHKNWSQKELVAINWGLK